MKRRFTDEQEQLIIGKYKGGVPMKEITAEFECTDSLIYSILARNNVYTPRKNQGTRRKPVCKHCGEKNPVGAKFCCMCGKSLKTQQELVLDGLMEARAKCLQHIPAGIRSDVDSKILAAVELLKVTFNIK